MKIESRQSRVILPCHLNNHETLFGGLALKWMDEIAYITSTRFTNKKMVTLSVNDVIFLLPIKSGMIVDVVGNVLNAGPVKLVVEVMLIIVDSKNEKSEIAAKGVFTMVAVNDNLKVIRL